MGNSETIDSMDEDGVHSEWLELVRGALVVAARRSVGSVNVVDAQRLVRCAMFAAALERTSGNRHAAARLLGVDRRYVTKMAKKATEAPEAAMNEVVRPITRPL